MTVRELKERLEHFSDNLDVKVWKDDETSQTVPVKYIHYVISEKCLVIGK